MREYTENGKGMVVGGILYQGMGLSSYHPLVTEIYTNAMTSEHKNIGRFHLTRANLEFTDSIVNLIVLKYSYNNAVLRYLYIRNRRFTILKKNSFLITVSK